MIQHFSDEAQQAGEMHSQVSYDLLARTVSRLSPDLLTELNQSAKEFLERNEQTNMEAHLALTDAVESVVNTLVTHINADNLRFKKESNDE